MTTNPTNPTTPKPGARRATRTGTGQQANRTRRRTYALAAAAVGTIIALTAGLTLLTGPDDLGPLDVTLKTDPNVNTSDRILIDQDNNGTPDTVLDLNHNNRADKNEPSLAELAHQRTTLINKIAANPTTIHESLITPPGNNWWTFTTSQAADLLLWESPAPTNALWYGLTTGRAKSTNTPFPTYHALHIGFPTAAAAQTYLTTAGTTTGPRIRAALRGTIVTLTSAHIDPYTEPFPATNKNLDATATDLRPTAAAWTLSLGAQHTDLAETAKKKTWGTALTTYHHNLGFTSNTTWNAVAPTPEGPWVGTLTDYEPANLDLIAASKAIASTQKVTCDKYTCTDVGQSLTNLTLYASYATPNIALTQIDPNNPTYAPDGSILAFTVNNTAIRGITEGSYVVPSGPYTLMQGTITRSGDRLNLIATITKNKNPTQITTTPVGSGTGATQPDPTRPDPSQPQPGDPVTPIAPGKNTPTPTPPPPPTN